MLRELTSKWLYVRSLSPQTKTKEKKHRMKKLLVGAAVLACMFATCTQAAMISVNDPGIAGILWGQAGDTHNMEASFAQQILDLGAGITHELQADDHYYSTSSTDYTGTIIGLGTPSAVGATHVDAGWEWVLAKYDGQEAGYVLFYLGGAAMDLPATSADLWLNSNGVGYGISHFTTFNGGSVPDGGSTLALLGAGLCGLFTVARYQKKA